ncbi:DNA polymerase Y family protein [Flavobacterium sp. DG1-102-2]|uniref:Y-family DNA polymerase n=1 Tax=Flavobacterium sp. DG1-102-2 TaxID=3081663 RepID=UPI002949F3EF|nr:DNA polymerase Y family protein [Flavobacterium sp. DG1-102-2]MDV6168132.1 DNA polymerase Y family protein [Flavobacterium sp. DG1-102-2]
MPRYASIAFPFLLTEYAARKQPELCGKAFVMASRQRGRMVIDAVSMQAAKKGIANGMVLADCKAVFPELGMMETEPGRTEKILQALAEWSIMYTPYAAVDLPDGLLLDISGCAHLWGGEEAYLEHITAKLNSYGYTIQAAIADTIASAWAVARFAEPMTIVKQGKQRDALQSLPPAALRLEATILARLKKLGMRQIGNFINMPSSALRRRFGKELPKRIAQALGTDIEWIVPVQPVEPYQERLSGMEPIASAIGITIALQQLLEMICARLQTEGLGLRNAVFRCYRVDGIVQQLDIGTGHPSRNTTHLFKLFEHKIATLEPALGFEVFVLEAPKVEPVTDEQAAIWNAATQNDKKVAELLDRVTAKIGPGAVSRYLPAEHHWPERSIKQAVPLWEKPVTEWRTDLPRPIHLLPVPETIEVSAVLPDYPPMLFRHKGTRYSVAKADGPERIEQEWWLSDGLYRDYYVVEDDKGARYWLFRSGPYDGDYPKWFLHGFFA